MKKTLKRRKPSIAFVTQDNALDNIKHKLEILELFGFPKVDQKAATISIESLSLPKSLRQFNHWKLADAEAQSLGIARGFKSNSQDTIRRHPILRKKIELALSSCKHIFDENNRSTNVDVPVKARKLKNATEKQAILEDELVSLRREMRTLREDRNRLENELSSLKSIMRREIANAVEVKMKGKRQGQDKAKLIQLVKNEC